MPTEVLQKYDMLAKLAVDDLMERCRSVVARRPGGAYRFARDFDVAYHWLTKFLKGDIPNPGILHINRVYAALEKLKNDEQ